jgi:protein-tyrosine-phosphatase
MTANSTSTSPATRSGVRVRWLVGGMLALAVGYFVWYTPYAALTKALSSGLVPGVDALAGGLVLLPAAALGSLVGAPLFLAATGWWRYVGNRRVLGRMRRLPDRTMITAGFFMALVIATTTLNYTFAGVSILFMLLMMRGGILVLSPLVDAVRRRRVRVYSWVALGLSLAAVTVALIDVTSYELTIAAVLSLTVYFIGYIGRFRIMSRVAKTGDEAVDRRYLAEEALSSAVWQVALCVVFALVLPGAWGDALREGFTTFLFSRGAIPAFGIGLLYSALYVYGTLIYLDPREYTWCVPANRCASLLSGLVASFGLAWLAGIAPPGTGQLVATAFIGLAIAALTYPAIKAAVLRSRPLDDRPLLLFVCDHNTSRSAMAESLARADIAAAGIRSPWQVVSAGLSATPGVRINPEAAAALRRQGVQPHRHRARQLTPDLIHRAQIVYCMSTPHCAEVRALAPDSADKIRQLTTDGEIPSPSGQPPTVYDECASQIRAELHQRLAELAVPMRALAAEPV